MKLDENGNCYWNKTYGGNSNDAAYAMCLASDGGVVMAGYTQSTTYGGTDYMVLKTDEDGNIDWQRHYGSTSNDYAYSVCQTSDGGYAVTGLTYGFGSSSCDIWTLKLNETGIVQWGKKYGGTGYDAGLHIIQTTDSGFIIAGNTQSFGASSYDQWILKLDDTGCMEWNITYGSTYDDRSYSLCQTSDGGYVISGFTNSYGMGDYDYWLIKLNSTGNITWQRAYGGDSLDMGVSASETSDQGLVVTGMSSSFGAGNDDIWVIVMGGDGGVTFDYGSGANVTITNTVPTSPTSVTASDENGNGAATAYDENTPTPTVSSLSETVETQATYNYGWY